MLGAISRVVKSPVAIDLALFRYSRGCCGSANGQSITKKQPAKPRKYKTLVLVEKSIPKSVRKASSEAKSLDGDRNASSEAKSLDGDRNARSSSGEGQGEKGGSKKPPSWLSAAAILAVTAGGVYLLTNKPIKKKGDIKTEQINQVSEGEAAREPSNVTPRSHIPEAVQYLVVGGGTAAFSAIRALRAHAPEAKILVVSEEGVVPYMRPPLSKELWHEDGPATDLPEKIAFTHWDGRKRALSYEPPAFYTPPESLKDSDGGASLVLGWRVTSVETEPHRAVLTAKDGTTTQVTYEKCLLVPGSRPRRLAALDAPREKGRCMSVRSLSDVVALRREVDKPDTRRVLLVGGGFLATEMAASLKNALKKQGKEECQVILVYRSAVPMSRVLPHYLGQELAEVLTQMGVTLLPEDQVVTSAVDSKGRVEVTMASGKKLNVDMVVEAVGHEPRTELATAAGLEIAPDGGIAVNAELQARTDLYVAGDAASYWSMTQRRRIRPEHHDHAVHSSRHAAANMAGANSTSPAYNHTSMFWSDLGPHHGYEATGDIHSELRTVAVFPKEACQELNKEASAPTGGSQSEGGPSTEISSPKRRYGRGVVFYLNETDRVVGVLLWNLYNRMHLAKQVLAQGEFDDLLEVAKLFTPHDQ